MVARLHAWTVPQMRVLSLCDRTGNMVRPWLEAGHEAVTVDLQPAAWEHPRRQHVEGDVRDFFDVCGFDLAFAFPPCTHLAASGARWFRDKGLRALIDGLEIVEACRARIEATRAPWMLENPVGSLATYWRQPDHMFHPVHYAGYSDDPAADEYTKKTCLWTGGGFVMPDRKPGEPTLGSLMHRVSPSEDRADIRSATPIGFARAVFLANEKVPA
jgi:hypothetical protein